MKCDSKMLIFSEGSEFNISLGLLYQKNVVVGLQLSHIEMAVSMQLEMMSDAIDETLDKDEAEEETEELTNQVT